jgi:hypothetical protein
MSETAKKIYWLLADVCKSLIYTHKQTSRNDWKIVGKKSTVISLFRIGIFNLWM